MQNRQNYHSGTEWEDKVVYSRAVKINKVIEVSGTTAVDENGDVIGKNDPYEQAKFCFKKIETALNHFGASYKNVVRTRMYVCDITQWEEIGRAHKEVFEGINPAATMVEVSRLINKELLIEIEVSAIIDEA